MCHKNKPNLILARRLKLVIINIKENLLYCVLHRFVIFFLWLISSFVFSKLKNTNVRRYKKIRKFLLKLIFDFIEDKSRY